MYEEYQDDHTDMKHINEHRNYIEKKDAKNTVVIKTNVKETGVNTTQEKEAT